MKIYCLLITLFTFLYCGLAQSSFAPSSEYKQHASRAYSYYDKGFFLISALSYDSLFQQHNGDGLMNDRYNAACSWAKAGNKDKAFVYLMLATSSEKFTDLTHLQADGDLRSLRSDARWKTVIEKVKQNKEQAEAKLNKNLVAMLDSILEDDQNGRIRIDDAEKKFGSNSKEVNAIWKEIAYKDSINLIKVKKIVDTYGWPGPDLIGEKGCTTVFLVIQHADSLTQATCLPLMKNAVKEGKARAADLALLEDRVLVTQGKEQLYGSQVKTDLSTGKMEFYPIYDEANVNKRRAAVGLQPLEEYAKYFGIDYKLPKESKHQ